jgi:transcriptional regulator with XRE-family HTH domain
MLPEAAVPKSAKPAEAKASEEELSEEERKAIGARIKEGRAIKGMAQNALADEVGVTQSYMSRLESGDREAGLAVLLRIAKVLGQPVGWIAADEGPGPVARPTVSWEQRDQRRRRDPRGK